MPDIYLRHFYLGDGQKLASHSAALLSIFDGETRTRIEKARTAEQRLRSLASKLMLYHALGDVIHGAPPQAFPLRYGPKGNPYFSQLPYHCSVSYQAPWISVALALSGKIGIDIERGNRNGRFRLLPQKLKARLRELNISSWNELEAYAKYWNEGLSILFADPFPAAEPLAISHYPLSTDLDCCVIRAPDLQLEQRYLMLDDLIFYFNNPFANQLVNNVTEECRPKELNNGSCKKIPAGRVLTPAPQYHATG